MHKTELTPIISYVYLYVHRAVYGMILLLLFVFLLLLYGNPLAASRSFLLRLPTGIAV